MKRVMTVTVLCACLLIGSLYPKLLLKHHVKLADQYGNEVIGCEEAYEELDEKLPVKLEFRVLEFFRR